MSFFIKLNKDDSTIKAIDDFRIHLNKQQIDNDGMLRGDALYFLTHSSPDIDITSDNFYGNQYISYIEVYDENMNLLYETNHWNYCTDVWDNGTWIREIFKRESDPFQLQLIYPHLYQK